MEKQRLDTGVGRGGVGREEGEMSMVRLGLYVWRTCGKSLAEWLGERIGRVLRVVCASPSGKTLSIYNADENYYYFHCFKDR